jgi:hypothetical protein
MGIISESAESATAAPAVGMRALEACDLLRRSLELSFLRGPAKYRYQDDADYRAVRRQFLADLRGEPCLAKLARTADRVLPVSLAQCTRLSLSWWENSAHGGRMQLIDLQDRMIVALEKAQRFAPVSREPTPSPPMATPSMTISPTTRPNRAQRRAEVRKRRAQELRAAGKAIKEIAAELGCSERTVMTYLQDPQ